MKKLSVLSAILLTTLCVSTSFGQLLLTEDFDYAIGDSLRAHGWTVSGTVYSNGEKVTSPSLTFTGFPGSGVGNATTLATTGEDVYKSFDSVNSGSVYLSFMMNVQTAGTGDYFIALSPGLAQTNYLLRFYLKSTSGGYLIGLSKSNEVAAGAKYGTTVLALNTTYAVVAKYQFIPPADTNDVLSAYVFDTFLPLVEPTTPEVGPYVVGKADAANMGNVTIRQGTTGAASALRLDGIRVTTSWETALPIQLMSFNASTTGTSTVELKWSTLSETNNYGFEVQKSLSATEGFVSISPLIAGKGTTHQAQQYSFVDNSQVSGRFYRLKQIDLDQSIHYSEPITVSGVTGVANETPARFSLAQNFPNPFNPATEISYQVGKAGPVKLVVMDMLGREVATLVNENKAAGHFTVRFNASSLASGAYVYRLTAGSFKAMQKMLLVK